MLQSSLTPGDAKSGSSKVGPLSEIALDDYASQSPLITTLLPVLSHV